MSSSTAEKEDVEVEGAALPPLSPQDIDAYIRDGFILLKNAFPSSVAKACRYAVFMCFMDLTCDRLILFCGACVLPYHTHMCVNIEGKRFGG